MTHHDRVSTFARLLALLLLAACQRGSRPEAVEYRRLVPSLRIGSEQEGPAYLFTETRQVAATEREVFVLPAEVPEIRVFDQEGRHRRTIGRRGAGPGEFDDLTAIGFAGDTLWTLDSHLRRVTRFTTEGELLGTARFASVSPEVGRPGVFYFVFPKAVMPDGSLLGFGGTSGRAIATGLVTATPLLHIAATTGVTDTLGWVPIGNEHLILRSARGTMYRAQPFADAPLTAYAPSAGRVFVVERYAATREGEGVVRATALRVGGDTAWSVRLAYAPIRLERTHVDSVRAQLTRAVASRFPTSEVDRALWIPAFRPPVTDILAGDDGTLWIGWEPNEGVKRFTVLGTDGRTAFQAYSPAGTRLLWAGAKHAWGQVVDSDDVPALVRFDIVLAAQR